MTKSEASNYHVLHGRELSTVHLKTFEIENKKTKTKQKQKQNKTNKKTNKQTNKKDLGSKFEIL